MQLFKNLLKRILPKSIIFKISPTVVRWYSNYFTWYKFGRHYQAPIDPFELIYIQPSEIQYGILQEGKNQFGYSNEISEIVDGDWDKKLTNLERNRIKKAFEIRFVEDGDWEDSEYYSNVVREIKNGKEQWGCTSTIEFKERLQQLDEMYESMKECGYKSQRELRKISNDDTALRDIHRYWPPELHEVQINIDREGDFIFHDGRHRLFMAQILNIDKIPVRVKTRHENWQQHRDMIYVENRESDKHPDIQFT